MKKLIFTVSTILLALSSAKAQTWKGNGSAGFGLLNPKARIQYEMPLNKQFTLGANMNWYFANWQGPIIEPFVRVYGKNGNDDGFFGQFKLGYGNLTTADINPDLYSNTRSSVFGGGLGCGYKFLVANHFTIEPYFGVRLYTTPTYDYKTTTDAFSSSVNDVAGGVGWFLTTGLPIEFNWKIGYQF